MDVTSSQLLALRQEGQKLYANSPAFVARRSHSAQACELGIIVPLVDCGAFEAAGVVDGATRAKAAVFPSLIDAIKEAIDVAKNELGFGYELAARRGEQMTGDELVDYAQRAVSKLTGSLST